MKNKKLLTVLVAIVMAVVVSLTATIAVLGASNEVTVNVSNYSSAVIDTLPEGLNDGDTLVVICGDEKGAFVNTEDAPALNAIKYVVGDVTVVADLDLATTAKVQGIIDVTGVGIAVEIQSDITLPENAAKLFGDYASYVVGVGAAGFDANEAQVNAGETVGFEVAVTMPEGVNVVVYDANYNVVSSAYSDGKVSFEGKLGEGYAIAPEMVAVVDGVGYPTLEEAITVAEGSFDAPVAIIGEGTYVLDTSSQVVVGIAGNATVTVANDVFSYVTEVTYEGSEYTAYALYQKDYIFASIVDAINASSKESGYAASYTDGELELKAIIEDASDLIDVVTLDQLYDIIGSIAPLAVVADTIALDDNIVYDGTFDITETKNFVSSIIPTFEEISNLTSKTVATFEMTVASGETVVSVPVSFTFDCTDEEFENIKEYAATVAEYIIITNDNGVLTVIIDATELYDKAVANSDAKKTRDEINALTINQFVDMLEASGASGKYAIAVDAIAKVTNKIATTDYAANLDVAMGILDEDEDGIYTADKTVAFSTASLITKIEGIIKAQYPEYADMFDVSEMIGETTISVSLDVTVKVFDQYTATFVDENGDVLYTETILEGEVPTYVGETPVKKTTETAVYTFFGWNDGEADYETLPEITADTTYTVVFTETLIEAIDKEINPKSASVVFNTKMYVKFYVSKEALDVYENFYANVVITTEEGDVEVQVEGTENGVYYQFIVNGIAAKQINDNIAIEIVATKTVENVQITRKSEIKNYSVAEYAYNRIAHKDSTDLEKTLLVDFLNYGAAAQTYFNYNADELANAALTDEQKAYGSATVPALESDFSYEGRDTEQVIFKGASVLFVDNVAVKFVINFNNYLGTTSDVQLVVSCNGIETIVSGEELVANGNYYTYTYENLAFKELRSPIEVTVVETATGEVLSGPLTYSVETYAYNKQSSTDANFVELLNSLMKFAISAEAFL